MDFIEAKRKRDQRLRRKILTLLKIALPLSPSGELSGLTLMEQVNGVMPRDQRFEDQTHALTLCREMTAKGLIAERDGRTHPRRQRFGLETQIYRITEKGLALFNETIPPDPDVEDDRLEE